MNAAGSDALIAAVLGAGRVGTAIARALRDAGYRVTISASGDPARLASIARIIVPGVEPMWAGDAIARADVVVLSIPLHRATALQADAFAGKIVIDAMNYWPPVDGVIQAFEHAPRGTSGAVQDLLPGAQVVKTFNHTGYHDLEPDRRPPGHPERLALAVAGDSIRAVRAVSEIVHRVGYDPVPLFGVDRGRALQPGGDVFGARLNAERMVAALQPERGDAQAA